MHYILLYIIPALYIYVHTYIYIPSMYLILYAYFFVISFVAGLFHSTIDCTCKRVVLFFQT